MTPENKKRVQEAVALAGKDLEGRLKPVPEIPNRNPYAHLWKEIKLFYGHSYTQCTDDQVNEILSIIEWARENPDVFPEKCMHCEKLSATQPYDDLDDPWKCPHCEKNNWPHNGV